MAIFFVRVELHGATYAQYEALHAAMERAGFSRTVPGVGGGRWKLPTAEYYGTATMTAVEIRDLVRGIADAVKQGAWVLVVESASSAWFTEGA